MFTCMHACMQTPEGFCLSLLRKRHCPALEPSTSVAPFQLSARPIAPSLCRKNRLDRNSSGSSSSNMCFVGLRHTGGMPGHLAFSLPACLPQPCLARPSSERLTASPQSQRQSSLPSETSRLYPHKHKRHGHPWKD